MDVARVIYTLGLDKYTTTQVKVESVFPELSNESQVELLILAEKAIRSLRKRLERGLEKSLILD